MLNSLAVSLPYAHCSQVLFHISQVVIPKIQIWLGCLLSWWELSFSPAWFAPYREELWMKTTSQWCCQMVRIYNASQSELLQHQSPMTQLNRRINQQLSIWPVVHWYNGRVYKMGHQYLTLVLHIWCWCWSGYVYGEQALTNQARQNDGKVICPR